ncbi:MAG TPA: threonine/serine dehydratase [Candidatus Binatia bacterium]|nr:threonine/serine dehydratase [Candidatus Binatia bacterium]
MVTLQNIQNAQKNIAPYTKSTPLVRSKFLSELCNAEVFLKLENLQVTHSFKIRGVINKLLNLTSEEKARGVVTASAGNHGQAVAFGARELGFKAEIVVPTNTPKVKVDGILQFGAELVLYGATYTESERKAKELAQIEGRLYISPYNDELIVAGHGTVGLEVLAELPNVDVIVVPVGGGGLISGVSIALKSLKPKVQVYGVQSAAVPIMFESLKSGEIVKAHRHEPKTIAEGLSGGIEKGSITFGIVQKYVDEVFLVREESIRHSVYLLWENEKQVMEGSGAATVALLLEKKDLFIGKKVALVLTGGNIDDSLFQTLLAWEK